MVTSAILPVFIVTLREAFEAILLVGIVFACLQQAQKSHLNRWVYQGIAGGVVTSLLVGSLLAGLFQGVTVNTTPYTPILKVFLSAMFGAVAVGLLSWMLLWMTAQAKTLKQTVQGEVLAAIDTEDEEAGGRAVALVVFIAVLREGFEMVLFLAAQGQVTNLVTIGAALGGIGVAILLAYGIFQWGIKVNLRRFFQVIGTLLLLIVAGLVVSVLKNIDQAAGLIAQLNLGLQLCVVPGDSCLLGAQVWNLAGWLPDNQFPGLLLKTLVGYRDHIYLLQAVSYGLFWLIIGRRFWKNT